MENKVVPTYLIVNADELDRLIRENLALKKDLMRNEFACLPCDFCRHSSDDVEECTGDCSKCGSECRCRDCGTENRHFEWRGIVPETEPSAEDVEAVRRRLTARRKEETTNEKNGA